MGLVEVSAPGTVATLVLRRPEARNALSAQMCDEVVHALGEVPSDARVVVIRGEGAAFCAGADFAAVSGPDATSFIGSFEAMLETLARFHLPTIARIHGAALGGGLQLATACDFRIAADDARLGIPSSRLGIVVNFENVQRLALLVGIAGAKEVLMTARTYVGAEAADKGLIDRCVPGGRLDDAVSELADEIASLAPLSVRGAKRALQVIADHLGAARDLNPEAVGRIDALVAEAYASEDLAEGLAAMAEKRKAHFSGH